jgi:hypothetical protein
MLSARTLLPAAAAGLIALAGCGSSDNGTTTQAMTAHQYSQFLQSLSTREDQAHKTLDQALQAKSLDQIQQGVSAFATDQSGAANQVSSVTPPANARSANGQLEKAFKDIAVAIQAVLPQIASAGSPQAALTVVQKAEGPQQAGHELDSALSRLRKLGYTRGS